MPLLACTLVNPKHAMRIMGMLSWLLFLSLLAFGAWPYYQLYRLDKALVENDQRMLYKIVDLDAVRRRHKQVLEQNLERLVGPQDNPVINFVRGGIRALGDSAYESIIDMDWVRDRLLATRREAHEQHFSLLGGFSFAFFETPIRFLARAGELGEDPVHLYLTLQNWRWRVTALYI